MSQARAHPATQDPIDRTAASLLTASAWLRHPCAQRPRRRLVHRVRTLREVDEEDLARMRLVSYSGPKVLPAQRTGRETVLILRQRYWLPAAGRRMLLQNAGRALASPLRGRGCSGSYYTTQCSKVTQANDAGGASRQGDAVADDLQLTV